MKWYNYYAYVRNNLMSICQRQYYLEFYKNKVYYHFIRPVIFSITKTINKYIPTFTFRVTSKTLYKI